MYAYYYVATARASEFSDVLELICTRMCNYIRSYPAHILAHICTHTAQAYTWSVDAILYTLFGTGVHVECRCYTLYFIRHRRTRGVTAAQSSPRAVLSTQCSCRVARTVSPPSATTCTSHTIPFPLRTMLYTSQCILYPSLLGLCYIPRSAYLAVVQQHGSLLVGW